MTVPTRTLGSEGLTVSALGLGCMGMSQSYGPADETESTATLLRAVERGITLYDTANAYGLGHNEQLVGRVLAGHRDEVALATKFGIAGIRDGRMTIDGSPAYAKKCCDESLQRLGIETIDLYYLHRVDKSVPIEETIGAMAEMIKAGYIKHIGLSEVGSETIRRAHAVHPIADLQIEYSLVSRGIESDILKTCRELGIGITAYGVLSRGLISGHWSKDRATAQDFRGRSPRFQGENLDRNLELVDSLRAIAGDLGATPAQVAIAWVAAQGNDIVPLIGARRRERLTEALGALDVKLTNAHLAALAKAFPPGVASGNRYPDAQLVHMDSEKRAS